MIGEFGFDQPIWKQYRIYYLKQLPGRSGHVDRHQGARVLEEFFDPLSRPRWNCRICAIDLAVAARSAGGRDRRGQAASSSTTR